MFRGSSDCAILGLSQPRLAEQLGFSLLVAAKAPNLTSLAVRDLSQPTIDMLAEQGCGIREFRLLRWLLNDSETARLLTVAPRLLPNIAALLLLGPPSQNVAGLPVSLLTVAMLYIDS